MVAPALVQHLKLEADTLILRVVETMKTVSEQCVQAAAGRGHCSMESG